MQAGHFRHGVLDHDEDNIRCQCTRCNKWLSGNLAEYSRRLLKEIGRKRLESLHQRADKALKGHKRDETYYEELITKYREELRII